MAHLYNLGAVDPDFYVLREADQGDELGALVAVSTANELTFQPANSTRVLWLMNAANQTDYACAWQTGMVAYGIWRNARYQTAAMNDAIVPLYFPSMSSVPHDPAPVLDAFDLINGAWSIGGTKLGRIAYSPDSDGPHMQFAFSSGGLCGGGPYGGCYDLAGPRIEARSAG